MKRTRRFFRVSMLASGLALLAVPAAQAAANHSLQGGGTTTQFLCSSGVATGATINFGAQKSKGILSGNFFIAAGGGYLSGSLTSGSINSGSYSLSGAVNGACGTATHLFPGTATISGDCGTGVTIYYSDSYGDVGQFLGNVACS